MLTTAQCGLRDLVVDGSRHDDRRRVNGLDEILEPIERANAELRRHLGCALAASLVESPELSARDVAQDANMVVSERTSANDSDAHVPRGRCHRQITSPRSLRSRKLRNSSTSGKRCSSSSARSRAWERFRSELKNRR